MAPTEIEPLEPVLWFAELRKLLDRVVAINGEAPDAIVRKAYYLCLLAPERLRRLVISSVREDRLEGLLEGGAYDEAMLSLINPMLGIELKRNSRESVFEATLLLPDGAGRGTGSGDTIAKALLSAWVDCFFLIGRGMSTKSSIADPNPHKSRCAMPRRSTRH